MAKKQEQRREAPKPAPMPVKQAIRQAGPDTITKPELKQIIQDSGKSSAAVLQKIDQVNKNLKQNDKTGISLGAGATNMLIREASKVSPTGYDAYLSAISGQPRLGSGKLGTEIQRRATEFGTTGSMGSLIPRGMTTMPSGRLSLPGIGNQYELPKTTVKNTYADPLGSDRPTNLAGTPEVTPTVQEEVTPMTPEAMQTNSTIGIGADLSNWATGFKSKKSSRGRAGRSAQGLASQRVSPRTNTIGM